MKINFEDMRSPEVEEFIKKNGMILRVTQHLLQKNLVKKFIK
jgi:hypothetical protein